MLATKFDEVCVCVCVLLEKTVYEEDLDDLFQTAASLTAHH